MEAASPGSRRSDHGDEATSTSSDRRTGGSEPRSGASFPNSRATRPSSPSISTPSAATWPRVRSRERAERPPLAFLRRVRYRSACELRRPRTQVPPSVLRRPGRARPRHPHAGQRHNVGPRRARVPLHRRPRRRQDHERSPAREVPELPRRGRQRYRCDRHALPGLRPVHARSRPGPTSTSRRSTARATTASTRCAASRRGSRSARRATASRSTSWTRSTCSRPRRGTRS